MNKTKMQSLREMASGMAEAKRKAEANAHDLATRNGIKVLPVVGLPNVVGRLDPKQVEKIKTMQIKKRTGKRRVNEVKVEKKGGAK